MAKLKMMRTKCKSFRRHKWVDVTPVACRRCGKERNTYNSASIAILRFSPAKPDKKVKV